MAADGIDPRKIRLDWDKVKASQRERAVKEVKASLVVNRIADAEGIHTTNEEVDREVHRIARQEREPAAAVRKRLEKENGLQRIASRIRTEKTLNFLFEHARKVAPAG
jgi:trigger factor